MNEQIRFLLHEVPREAKLMGTASWKVGARDWGKGVGVIVRVSSPWGQSLGLER